MVAAQLCVAGFTRTWMKHPFAMRPIPLSPTQTSAMFSELDDMSGVSENIIMGQLCPLGTACFDLMLDMDLLEFAIETPTTRSPDLQ